MGLVQVLPSDPIEICPPWSKYSRRGKNPSPRLASVVGQMPTVAPDLARAVVSCGVMCVA